MRTHNNLAKSIAIRREVHDKLYRVQQSLEFLERSVAKKIEDNNEEIALMQSVLENPLLTDDLDHQHFKEFEISKEKMATALAGHSQWTSIETYSCLIQLKNVSEIGTDHQIRIWSEQNLSFNHQLNESKDLEACRLVFNHILLFLKEDKLWNPVADELPLFMKSPLSLSISSFGSSSESFISDFNDPMCFLRFTVDGAIQPEVVIRLDFDQAPKMCQSFLDYCLGSHNFTYKFTRIFMVFPSNFLNFFSLRAIFIPNFFV